MKVTRRRPQPLRSENDREGVATVELAVVLPLFLTIVLGIGEMSRALDAAQRLTIAVREGAREASTDLSEQTPPGWTTNQKVVADIKTMLAAGGLDSSQVTVTITHAEGSKAGQPFDLEDSVNYLKYYKVTASIDYAAVGMFPPRIMANKKLTSSVVFRMGFNTSLAG